MNSESPFGFLSVENAEAHDNQQFFKVVDVFVPYEEVKNQTEVKVEEIEKMIIKVEEMVCELKKKVNEIKINLEAIQRNEQRKEVGSLEISGNETVLDLERKLKEKETEFDQIHEIKTRIDFSLNKGICGMTTIISQISELVKFQEDELFLKAQIVDNKMNKLIGEMGLINNEIKKKKEEEIEKEFELKKEELNQMKPIPTTKWNNETTLFKLFDGVFCSCFNNVIRENPCSSFYNNIKVQLNKNVQTIVFDSEWNGFDFKLFCLNCVEQKDIFIILTRQDEKKEIMFIPQLPKVTDEVCCKSVMFPINYHFQNTIYDEIYEIETKISLKECDDLMSLHPLLFLNKFKSIQFPTGFGHGFLGNVSEIGNQPSQQTVGLGNFNNLNTHTGGVRTGLGSSTNSATGMAGLGTGITTMGSGIGMNSVEVNNLTTNLKWINPISSLKNYKRVIVLGLN